MVTITVLNGAGMIVTVHSADAVVIRDDVIHVYGLQHLNNGQEFRSETAMISCPVDGQVLVT